MNIITSKDAKDAETFFLSARLIFFLNCGENFPEKSLRIYLFFALFAKVTKFCFKKCSWETTFDGKVQECSFCLILKVCKLLAPVPWLNLKLCNQEKG